MDRERDHIVLTMAVDDDDLAETGVPEAGKYIGDVVSQDLFRDHDRSLLSKMMVGMGAVPDGLCHCAAGAFCYQFTKAGIQISILAVRCRRSVVLGGADRKKKNIVFLKTFSNHVGRHVLIINTVLCFHVAAFCGQIPVAHKIKLLSAQCLVYL